MTEVETLAATLGLRVEPCGAGWRLSSPTGVPLYVAFLRGTVGGGKRWLFTPVLDLAAVNLEKPATVPIRRWA